MLGIIVPLVILFTDFDGDGLSNSTEFRLGTSMFNSDTDRDGLNDGLEVNIYGANPMIRDTDSDGLDDGTEVNIYRTNPLIGDTDNDGLDDGTEALGYMQTFELTSSAGNDIVYSWNLEYRVLNGTSYHTWHGNSWSWPSDYENILKDNGIAYVTSDPLSTDTDGDGLNDKMEQDTGTNPRSKDTDNDGLDDKLELTTYKTIPVFYDTDGDLLGDGEEINKYATDPLNWDSDNDHLSDGMEVKGYDVNGDGIIDVNFPAFGANPLVKDIFVEVDWMPSGQTLGSYSQGKLAEAFAKHDIVLHIDQGELGGGSETDERPSVLYDERDGPMNDFYDFMEKYFTASRRGVFFWCLITNSGLYLDGKEVGGFNNGDTFTVAGTWWESGMGSTFMHELGHGLLLINELFDGIDSEKYDFDTYRSVMNYNSPHSTTYGGEFFNYSEGAPFNDWDHINFTSLRSRN